SAVRTRDETGAGRRALRHRGRGEWLSDDVRPDGHDAGDQPAQARGIRPETQKPALGKTEAEEGPMKRPWGSRVNQLLTAPRYSGVGQSGRVCWLTASLKACVCTDGLRPGRNCYHGATRGAGARLEFEARALILLPRTEPAARPIGS